MKFKCVDSIMWKGVGEEKYFFDEVAPLFEFFYIFAT